jgi:hypothetical protein
MMAAQEAEAWLADQRRSHFFTVVADNSQSPQTGLTRRLLLVSALGKDHIFSTACSFKGICFALDKLRRLNKQASLVNQKRSADK